MTAESAAGFASAGGTTVPPPPLGPGVQPPFVAPPTDGTRQRRWLAVGLATGFVVLVCIGGLVGLGGLVVLGTQVARDDASAAVTEYLTAVRDGEYLHAYSLLCDDLQARTSEREFINANLDAPRVISFTVGEVDLSDDIRVPATIRREDGTVDTVDFLMAQDVRTGAVEVCGQES
jgi:hypothetical protein